MLVVAATERELRGLHDVETLVCGIGPVEAAIHVTRSFGLRRPEAVLHVGIAGARTLAPLTVVLGSESVYCDVSAAIPVVGRAHPDPALLERCRAAVPEAAVLPIGTSAAVGGGSCDVEAMEGFGVLRACALAGVPAVELRVVANSPEESDRANWRIDDALELLGATLDRLHVV
jgi:futalosine hydrolase